ncbi:MAG: M15 family metallopeptidase [Flavobacteriales bacterium]|nr:M15 family metallopeptidase [Flavobacteriales bacterium]
MGRFNPAQHPKFTEVPVSLASRSGMFLRKEALTAFREMRENAQANGINLTIISASRNFTAQKRIWEAKWNGTRKVDGLDLAKTIPNPELRARKILKYSSMPGTSRHHWGTDIDINSLSPSYFESGKGKSEYEWLRDNAYRFGFCQVYSKKDANRPTGYEEEKWHWSYLPIAAPLTRFCLGNVKVNDIVGFKGSHALPIREVFKYVSGIATECR